MFCGVVGVSYLGFRVWGLGFRDVGGYGAGVLEGSRGGSKGKRTGNAPIT